MCASNFFVKTKISNKGRRLNNYFLKFFAIEKNGKSVTGTCVEKIRNLTFNEKNKLKAVEKIGNRKSYKKRRK
jgi:hypothetical protein